MNAARSPILKRQAGFTLIETLIVLAVIGILVLISAPAFLGMINRFKLTGTTRELASLMQAARYEAIKMNAPSQVNYRAASNKFIAFVDLDRDNVQSAADRILADHFPPAHDDRLEEIAGRTGHAGHQFLAFRQQGQQALADDCLEQLFLAFEIEIERALRDARPRRHLVQARRGKALLD